MRTALLLAASLFLVSCVVSPAIERRYRPRLESNLVQRSEVAKEIESIQAEIRATREAIDSGSVDKVEGEATVETLLGRLEGLQTALTELVGERDRIIAEAEAEAAEEGAAQFVAASDEVLGGLQILAAIFGLQGAAGAIGVGRGLMRGLRKQPEGTS